MIVNIFLERCGHFGTDLSGNLQLVPDWRYRSKTKIGDHEWVLFWKYYISIPTLLSQNFFHDSWLVLSRFYRRTCNRSQSGYIGQCVDCEYAWFWKRWILTTILFGQNLFQNNFIVGHIKVLLETLEPFPEWPHRTRNYFEDHKCAWFWKRRILTPNMGCSKLIPEITLEWSFYRGSWNWSQSGHVSPKNKLTIMNEFGFENTEFWNQNCSVKSSF